MAEVVVVSGPEEAGELVARAIVRLIQHKRDAVLGLATGSSPLSVYRALAELTAGMDMSAVRGFALDEYVGLDPAHPESYHSVINREVVQPLGLNPNNVHVPNGALDTLPHAGQDYEASMQAAGGVDLQLLGVGTDGHIGFNEPGSSLASRTRIKTLTRVTRKDNARFFDSLDQVPLHAITQGVGTILEARRLVLLGFGLGKAPAVAAAVEGPVTASVPASAVQLHPHVTVVVDEAAASQLRYKEYYQDAWANKPEWQRG